MTALAEIRALAGELIVAGFPGPSLDDETRQALAERRRGGVIHFRRNIESVEQIHELNRALLAATPDDHGLFLAVDQEGGRVIRVPPPAVQLPPMRVLGTLDHAGLARRAGAVVGEELRALGYNVDFAPVLDVDSNPKNPVIGDRSFGRNPLRVGELGTAFGLGLQDRGVLACGKHFPGHGDTSVDSHLALPVVHRTRGELEAVDLVPFRRAVEALGSLMTAHVVFDGLDAGVPATLSRKILHDLLRREMGYTGLVFSDDLEMRALADRMTVEESAVAAVRAGCDVLLVCQTPSLADRAYEALVREAERDPEFLARVSHSAHWSRSARRRYPARPAKSTEALRQVFEESAAPGVLTELEGRRSLRP